MRMPADFPPSTPPPVADVTYTVQVPRGRLPRMPYVESAATRAVPSGVLDPTRRSVRVAPASDGATLPKIRTGSDRAIEIGRAHV